MSEWSVQFTEHTIHRLFFMNENAFFVVNVCNDSSSQEITRKMVEFCLDFRFKSKCSLCSWNGVTNVESPSHSLSLSFILILSLVILCQRNRLWKVLSQSYVIVFSMGFSFSQLGQCICYSLTQCNFENMMVFFFFVHFNSFSFISFLSVHFAILLFWLSNTCVWWFLLQNGWHLKWVLLNNGIMKPIVSCIRWYSYFHSLDKLVRSECGGGGF